MVYSKWFKVENNRILTLAKGFLYILTFGFFPKSVYAARDLSQEYAFGQLGSLGQLVGILAPLIFTIGGIVVAFYFMIGAFDLIRSWGDKNAVHAARDKMMHAIIGIIILTVMFALFRALPTLIGLTGFSIIN